jgi:hypothetical protein
MVEAYTLVGKINNVRFLPDFNKTILYNVLMETHTIMLVNNIICETLNPENSHAPRFEKTSNNTPLEIVCA